MFSKNETKVLKEIIQNSKIANVTIANKVGLTSAGVGKIRTKLEKKGVIKRYQVDLDFNSMELNTFAILHIKVTTEGWNYKGGMGIDDFIASNTNITSVYRISGQKITHILFCVFRNLQEQDRFINVIQSQLYDYIEIVESHVFSSDSIIKDSLNDLLVKVLDEGKDKRMPEPVLFGKIIGEKE